ncbi:PP2C family protein-serine/threonine phosphatase [Microbacterium sp. zg.Y909]|uniref:PP2C family protein-serine/threonine phosphatase n=1 Tax=Microbacterium sp. zg.Y909 TaxID=2969413 RepID=UPI00214C49FF|nr:protein phosphatase 2C domain-containing protein [Microbacterium sp. zg.Y909]MCR2824798.1 protein phosphatase 2C domain-containing protein [Microbacterium sp. zg.Y909]
MVFQGSSVAISHTGKVRSNNQDSGYAGSNLFAVADGMGGHAGGDVASSIAINRLSALDHSYDSPSDAERALRDAIADTATRLIETVKAQPELAGMGTTVSALIMVDDYAVLAHIGDSRVYLYREGTLTQITTDHPRRSVLMRVLGDTDADPELDTFIMPTQPGDRWLLCSDGLSGVVDDAQTAKALGQGLPPGRTADTLLRQALDGGAPDNVTIVLVDVGGQHPVFIGTPTVVGSASNPNGVEVPAARSTRSGWLHAVRQAPNDPTHFEPAAEFLEELIEEDRRRAKSRRVWWVVSLVGVLLALALALVGAYSWTQTRFYVGADADTVVVYRGIQQTIGPISLSTPYADTGIDLDDLPAFVRDSVEETISASSLTDAQRIVAQLRETTEATP